MDVAVNEPFWCAEIPLDLPDCGVAAGSDAVSLLCLVDCQRGLGVHTITAADRLPTDLRQAIETITGTR